MARLVLWLERDLSRSLSRHSELMSVSSDQPLRFSGKWREFPFHSQTLMTMWTVIIRSDATCHRRGFFPGIRSRGCRRRHSRRRAPRTPRSLTTDPTPLSFNPHRWTTPPRVPNTKLMLAASRRVSKQGFCWLITGSPRRPLHASPRIISTSAFAAFGDDLGRRPIADEGTPSYVARDLARHVRRGIPTGEQPRVVPAKLAPSVVELPWRGYLDHPSTPAHSYHVPHDQAAAFGFGTHGAGAHTAAASRDPPPSAAHAAHPIAPVSATPTSRKKSSSSASSVSGAHDVPDAAKKKMYHFEIKGADAKKNMDRTLIKCMCHEVAAAAAERARAIFGTPSVASVVTNDDPDGVRAEYVADDFCVFSHTVMRDILDAKHAKHTFWGSTHWCGGDTLVSTAVRQMTKANVGALLVMDRVCMDVDADDVITEEELRSSPESGAIKGIISERDYLRAVAKDDIHADTKVQEIMIDFDSNPELLISVTPECSVLAAMQIMTEHRIRHIPCISAARGTRGAKMEGMITIGDVVKALISEEREEVALCHDYIQGAYS